ncbi:MAG: type II toxin-antitoxin system HicB family antitoxin, partial [Ktedonobacteraceae bacterium]
TEHRANKEFAGWIWAVVDVDFAALSNKLERVNITLPRRILRRIDAAARQAGESRSAYIARRVLADGKRKSA